MAKKQAGSWHIVNARQAVRAALAEWQLMNEADKGPGVAVIAEAWQRAVACGLEEIDGKIIYAATHSAKLQDLFKTSGTDRVSYEACRMMLLQLIARGRQLPKPLQDFVLKFLGHAPPTASRPRVKRRSARHYAIENAVYVATEYGLPATGKRSAAALVAEELAALGERRVSLDKIAKIWEKAPLRDDKRKRATKRS